MLDLYMGGCQAVPSMVVTSECTTGRTSMGRRYWMQRMATVTVGFSRGWGHSSAHRVYPHGRYLSSYRNIRYDYELILTWFVRDIYYIKLGAAKKFFIFSGQSTKAFSLSGQKNGYKKKKKIIFFP